MICAKLRKNTASDITMNDWQTLTSAITRCRACPRLVAWREEVAVGKRRAYRDEAYWGRPVPGFGDQDARVLIIGLAPAAHGANRTGRMFTGDSSGDFLYAALHRAGFASQPASRHYDDGLTLHDAFISAACRCAPPDNKPLPAEVAACRPFLEQEIALLSDLRVVVALGRIAFDAALRFFPVAQAAQDAKPIFTHAATYPLAGGRWLVASYHPSRQNTQTGRLTTEMFDQVWTQARRLLSQEPGVRSQPSVITHHSSFTTLRGHSPFVEVSHA
jgi:uracil-DNA glycosylase family 4